MLLVEFEVRKAFCCDRFLAPVSKSTFEPRTESLSSVPIKTREFKPSENWDEEECPTYDPSTCLLTGDLRVLPNIARFEKDSKPLVPMTTGQLQPQNVAPSLVREMEKIRKERQARNHDLAHGLRMVPPLMPCGESIRRQSHMPIQ